MGGGGNEDLVCLEFSVRQIARLVMDAAARSEQPGSWASRATLALIHFVLAITKILEDTFHNVVALVERSPTQDAFVHLRKKLAKAPNYVCIALTDDFSPAHVARVACWCSKLGIPQVAVWDRDGA